MVDISNYGTLPGVGEKRSTEPEASVWWGREEFLLDVTTLVLDASTRDNGNTPTNLARQGLILTEIAMGRMKHAVSGDHPTAVLLRGQDVFDDLGNPKENYCHALIAGAVKAEDLLIDGAAFIGHPDEFAMRQAMSAGGRFIFDDDIGNENGGGATVQQGAALDATGDPGAVAGKTIVSSAAFTLTLPETEGIRVTLVGGTGAITLAYEGSAAGPAGPVAQGAGMTLVSADVAGTITYIEV